MNTSIPENFLLKRMQTPWLNWETALIETARWNLTIAHLSSIECYIEFDLWPHKLPNFILVGDISVVILIFSIVCGSYYLYFRNSTSWTLSLYPIGDQYWMHTKLQYMWWVMINLWLRSTILTCSASCGTLNSRNHTLKIRGIHAL